VEHELGIDTKIVRQSKAGRVLLSVIRKLLTQTDKHAIKPAQHELIDNAGVSIVHGHSSHHPIAIEVYRNRLILYGCGDFLNDYEGISGYDEFLDDLTLMYFASVDLTSGNLLELDMMPLQMQRFQLVYAPSEDFDLLMETLDRESRKFGTRIIRKPDGRLALSWPHDQAERRLESALHESSSPQG